jgi:type VI protein secretion system component VasF
MSAVGFAIAIRAVPFFDLLDNEEKSLASKILDAGSDSSVTLVMDTSRRRLAQGVDAFVRSLPTAIRNDVNTSRAAAYALVGLADERMLHYPAGGLDRWRERLLEFELYGSALAGQEIVTRARASAYGAAEASRSDGGGIALLAPLYLGVFRSGFEGSLRGNTLELSSLVASLEETLGAVRDRSAEIVADDVRPTRVGLSPLPLALLGIGAWLASGVGMWMTLPQDSLQEAGRIAERISAGLPVEPGALEPMSRSIGPSGLPPLEPGSTSLRADPSLE